MNLKFIFTLIFLLTTQLSQAEVSLSVDRNPVVSDEAFKLIFETNHKHDGDPDFTPLEQNFTILNSGRRSNTQIINGDVTRSQQWILTVMAKQTGVLSIPAIQFGSDSSQVATIEVLKSAPSSGANTSSDVFIKSEVDTQSPYVQAQVVYTAKVYRSVQTNNAKLFEPVVSGGQAIINKLGEDRTYEERVNGKRYVVTERQFVIFPQSSGKLTIEPIMFQAQIGTSNFFNFDPFGPQPKSVVKQSESIELNIKAIPESFIGDTWLPAKQLSIQEQWSLDPRNLKQGEATTRTLTITAIGLPASNLPEVKTQLPDNLKQYPDQPEFSESTDKNGFTSLRHDKMAIIPVEGGNYVLPAIRIPWWNTETDKMEFAELLERTIQAKATSTTALASTEKRVAEETEASLNEELNNNTALIESEPKQNIWQWLSLLFFILWVITLLLFFRNKRQSNHSETSSERTLSHQLYLKQLKKACVDNNASLAKQALLDWAKTFWPDENMTNINAIKLFSNEELGKKIDELNHCLYGKEQASWNGAAFLSAFESQSFDEKINQQEKGRLEPLYKT